MIKQKMTAFFLLTILLAVGSCVKIDEINNVRQKSETVLKNLINAVEARDEVAVAKNFSGSAEDVLILPVADSLIIGRAQIGSLLGKLFQRVNSIKIVSIEAKVFPGADLTHARIAAACKVKIVESGQTIRVRALVSGFLVSNVGIWQFEQVHISEIQKIAKKAAPAAVATPIQKKIEKIAAPSAAAKIDSMKKAEPDTNGASY